MILKLRKPKFIEPKTLGRCPNTPRFFVKNRVKLLIKYRDESHGIFGLSINLTLISLLPEEGGKQSEPDEGKIRK